MWSHVENRKQTHFEKNTERNEIRIENLKADADPAALLIYEYALESN